MPKYIDADALRKRMEQISEESKPAATARPMREDTPSELLRYGTARAMIEWLDEIPAADVEPRQRWIPVTEKLPDVRQFVPYGPIASSKVFFKTSDKTIHLGYLTESSYVDKYDGKIVLHRWYDDHGDRIENVTKWCEPPKEETE